MELLKKHWKADPGEVLADTTGPRSLFRREIERALDRAWGAFEGLDVPEWPAMDVSEDDKAVTFRVDLPGLGPKDVEVEVSGDRLSIRGTRREERTEGDGGRERRERFVGSFARTVTLPPYADGEKAEASYDKGVLTVTAPKVPGRGPRRVAVKTS
jgi:HSP20 family protein